MNYLSHQADYLFETMFLKYPQILAEIRKPRYKVADTNFSSRNILTLDKAGLLPNRRETNSDWRKFNLNDLLFISIVKQCREFNMDSVQLKKLSQLFFVESKNFIKAKPIKGKAIEGEEVTATEQALMLLLTGEVPISIRIFNDGNVILADNLSFDFNPSPSIFLDINNLFGKAVSQFEKEYIASKYDLSEFEDGYQVKVIKPEDARLLRIIAEEEYTRVTITKKSNGKIDIQGEKFGNASKLTPDELYDLVLGIGHGKFEVGVDGKPDGYLIKKNHKIS